MIKVVLIVIALAEVSRLIVDIASMIDSDRVLKQATQEQKNAVEINANNLELTKSYGDKIESFNNAVLALVINLDKRIKVLEGTDLEIKNV